MYQPDVLLGVVLGSFFISIWTVLGLLRLLIFLIGKKKGS